MIAVIDALGHGQVAADVAVMAADAIEQSARAPIEAIMQRCHERLHGTRGAAITLARISKHGLAWLGVGNVEAVLYRADPTLQPAKESLISRGGVIGYRFPKARPETLARGERSARARRAGR